MKYTVVLFSALVFCACSGFSSYKINGVVSGDKSEGKWVYLSKYVGRVLVNIDSTTVRDGKFVFEGSQDSSTLRVLRIDDENISKLPFILENGVIYATLDSVSSAEGTPMNDTLTAHQSAVAPFDKKLSAIEGKTEFLASNNQLTDAKQEELNAESAKTEAEMAKVSENFISRNLNNSAGAYIFWQNRGTFTPELQKSILDKAGPVFKADQFVKIIISRLEMMKQVMVGMKFVDLTMNSPEGKKVSLSDYAGKGKVVLVEFWASWCPSCRQMMPSIVKTYAKYESKNFEIVGVSFDKNREDWVKGIQELGITWPQMSDLKFWSSAGAEQYAVRAIPHTVLLDKSGIIVAKDLDHSALESKIDELLK